MILMILHSLTEKKNLGVEAEIDQFFAFFFFRVIKLFINATHNYTLTMVGVHVCDSPASPDTTVMKGAFLLDLNTHSS
jgi:hypothetical protein